jgi:threonine/homoserine/homoserine lactone efflux protein
MDTALVVRGIVIGFSIAAPVGPIGVLCIRRTLADGRASGLLTGLGAATADAVYGAIAALGLTALTDALVGGQIWIRLIGGAFLLYLGVRTLLAKPSERAASVAGEEKRSEGLRDLLGAFASTFVLTLTNPMTILSFVAVFAALGLGTTHPDPLAAAGLVLGVFVGSSLWWLTLSGATSLFRSRFDERGLAWVNRISGAVIATFGLAAVGSLLFRS